MYDHAIHNFLYQNIFFTIYEHEWLGLFITQCGLYIMHSNCFVFPYMQAMGVTELFFVYECGMDNFTSKIFQGVVLMYIIILQVRSFQYYMQIVLKTFGQLFCKAITLSQLQYYQSLIIFLPLNYEVELV